MFVDKVTNELYVADGYGNHRVIVFDASTGAYKRHWGAYGTHEFAPAAGPDALSSAPDPAGIQLGIETAGARPKQFNIVHCAVLSNDRLLYVCDRANNRIQVFTAGGTYLKEQRYAPETARSGSVWGIAFSSDPAQAFLYVADGANEVVNLVRRDTLQQVGSFGDGGRQPGEFFGVHNIATDAKGNIYTTETYTGARLQRFLFKRVAPARAAGVAATWPPG